MCIRDRSNELAKTNDMDTNLAYMYMMMKESEGNLILNKRALEEYGSKVCLFPGVRDWFERIRQYGTKHGVTVEHYIISSGLKEMIEGTEMAKNGAFEKIYASSFYFNSRGVAVWPAQVINYTNKTQFLFRIEKGVLDINDPGAVSYTHLDVYKRQDYNTVDFLCQYIPSLRLRQNRGIWAIHMYIL